MSKLRTFTLLIALVSLLGMGLWFLTPAHPIKPLASVSAPRPQAAAPAVSTIPRTTPVPSHNPPTSQPKSAAPASALSIGNLVGSSSLDNKTVLSGLAQITLETDRSLDERTEALGHLLNLSAEDPAPVLLPLIGNRDLPDTLCNRILDDSLNAPPAWQADACLTVLSRRKDKALLARAHNQLAFLIGADHGSDLVAWTKAVAFLKETPAP